MPRRFVNQLYRRRETEGYRETERRKRALDSKHFAEYFQGWPKDSAPLIARSLPPEQVAFLTALAQQAQDAGLDIGEASELLSP